MWQEPRVQENVLGQCYQRAGTSSHVFQETQPFCAPPENQDGCSLYHERVLGFIWSFLHLILLPTPSMSTLQSRQEWEQLPGSELLSGAEESRDFRSHRQRLGSVTQFLDDSSSLTSAFFFGQESKPTRYLTLSIH